MLIILYFEYKLPHLSKKSCFKSHHCGSKSNEKNLVLGQNHVEKANVLCCYDVNENVHHE